MVPELQNGQGREVGEDGLLHPGVGVPGEEEVGLPEAHQEDHGEVVGVQGGRQGAVTEEGFPSMEGWGGGVGVQDPDLHAPSPEDLPLPGGPPGHAPIPGLLLEFQVGAGGDGMGRIQHAPNGELTEKGRGSSDVIQVGMAQDQGLQPSHPLPAEVGNHAARPGVPPRASGAGVHGDPAPVGKT